MQLFKYLHPDRIDLIENGLIRFTQPPAFNDPFDMKPHVAGIVSRELLDAQVSAALPKMIDDLYLELLQHDQTLVTLPMLQAHFAERIREIQGSTFSFAELMTPYIRFFLEAKLAHTVGVLCFTEKADSLLRRAD